MRSYSWLADMPPSTAFTCSWVGPGPEGPPSMDAMVAAAEDAAAVPTAYTMEQGGFGGEVGRVAGREGCKWADGMC